MPASTTACRLLCASVSAYFVDQNGCFEVPKGNTTVSKDNLKLYNNVGFLKPPTPFSNPRTGIWDKINAAILGETKDAHILAFRGTLPPNNCNPATLEDWGQDILEIDTVQGKGLPGKVHKGFYNAFESIWPKQIKPALDKIFITQKSTKPLFITGHSKGGPMATYAAYRVFEIHKSLRNDYPVPNIITFASPYPGNADFATAYDLVISQIRYENFLDIVPFVPPNSKIIGGLLPIFDKLMDFLAKALPLFAPQLKSFQTFVDKSKDLNYTSVGKLQYIRENGTITPGTPDDPDLLNQRIRDFELLFAESIFDKGFKEGVEAALIKIGHAHKIACGGGYERGVCSICQSAV